MSVWRPSTTAILVGGVVLIVIAVAVAFAVTHFQPRTEIRLGTGVFQAKLATDEGSRTLGLSGVESLKPNEGLLMVFDSDDKWQIWMKDMKIPLDIIWLDSSKKVVYTVRNAGPELSTDKIFIPTAEARYVLELPAGSVQQYGIKAGAEATFSIPGASS
jgi:uncharacterized membrane protein (UPF0127 family)